MIKNGRCTGNLQVHRLKQSAMFCVFGLLFVSNIGFAAELDKTTYVEGDQIIAPNGTGPVVLYNLDTLANDGVPYFETWGFDPGSNINYFGIAPGSYSLIELTTSGICQGQLLSYIDCKLAPEFVNEFVFNVVAPSLGGSNSASEGGFAVQPASNSAPQISILSPIKGSIFSRIGQINYEAVDRNDSGSGQEKSQGGLIDNPVSLFYSDKVDEQNYSYVDSTYKYLIAKGLPAIGKYDWTIKDLVPGTFYRIIANALDRGNLLGEAISDFFTVDYTPPVFHVKANPPAIRLGDVKISIDTSEDLAGVPEVYVNQNNSENILVKVVGENKHFEGVYRVISGHDGTARIQVSGKDMAGNLSTTTVSGGTFSVGINPPPAPKITYPDIKASINDDYVDVQGTTRDDTEVVLQVNGVKKMTVKPDALGNFIFKKIPLEKVKNQGVNYFSVTALDAVGTLGESTSIEVKRNLAPEIKISKPSNNGTVGDSVEIIAEGKDGNNDPLFYTYEIQPGKYESGSAWVIIGDNIPSSGFSWNATEVEDGDYVLRVTVFDGTIRVSSTPVHILVRNTLPFVRFENGRKTLTKDSIVTIYASAISSNNLVVRPIVQSVEYSLNKGVSWSLVKLSAAGTTYERKFSVTLPTLKEGIYPILWRVKDNRDIIGKSLHTVIVDRTAPPKPILSSPLADQIITSIGDKNQNQKGMQIDFGGSAEPGSQVALSFGKTQLTTKTQITGRFLFPDVTLSEKGIVRINLSATDEAGNKSIDNVVSLVYNNPPVITFINPKPFHGLSGKANIQWKITDLDGDNIQNSSLSYRRFGDSWKTLSTNINSSGSLVWDVSDFKNANDYELRIVTTDGVTPVTSISSFSIDKIAPIITNLEIDQNNIKNIVGITASGSATDDISGVEFVEYSIKNQSSSESPTWYKALITKGYVQTQSQFSIKYPKTLEDGTYVLSARAIDSTGNTSEAVSRNTRIDRTAPRIASYFVDINGMRLGPDENGLLTLPESISSQFGISLESDTSMASVQVLGRDLPLVKDLNSGLWTTSMRIDNTIASDISITAKDRNNNEFTLKKIGTIRTFVPGVISFINSKGIVEPIIGARMNVQKFDKETGSFKNYNFGSGSIQFVSSTDAGKYNLALPQGEYLLIVRKIGFGSIEKKVTLEHPGYIDLSFSLEPISGIRAWINNIISWILYK